MIFFVQESQERLQRGKTFVLALEGWEGINQAKMGEMPDPAGETECTNSQRCGGISHFGGWVRGRSLKAEAGKGQVVKGNQESSMIC